VKLVDIETLTGASGGSGNQAWLGAKFAVDEVNEAGGFSDAAGHRYTLEISSNDFANDKTEMIALVRKAASDSSVLAIIGPSASVGFVPGVPVVGGLKIPMIGDGTGAAVSDWNGWAYRVNAVASIASPQLLKIVVPKFAIKKIAVIYDQTNAGQVADEQVVKSSAQEIGYEVVGDHAFKPGQQDFSSIVSVVKDADPDAVWIAAAPGSDAGDITKQLRAAGVEAQILGGYGNILAPQVWDLSNGLTKGAISWSPHDFQHATGALSQFMQEYQAKNNLPVSNEATHGYDAVYTLVAAIKAASAADRNAVQQALSHLKTVTPLGTHVEFENPPTGENSTAALVALQVTARGEFKEIK
jgi:branched-chain amino acid transport system substrate-binding protein